jgi:membrane protease YdiL (CAAX protease family)
MVDWLFGPRRGIAASPWSPAGAVFLVLIVTVLAAVFAGVVMAGLVAATPWLRLAVETRCAGPSGEHCITALLGYLSLTLLFLVIGLLMACWFRRGATVGNSLLLRSAHWGLWQYAVFAVVTVLALVGLQQILFHLSALLGVAPADPMVDLTKLWDLLGLDDPIRVIGLVLVAVICAPLAEEFVFRGMLFAAFQKTGLGVVGSAVLLSAAWSALHWGYSAQNLIALFCLGLLFAYIVWRTGSLWPAIVGHAANNLAAVVALMTLQA